MPVMWPQYKPIRCLLTIRPSPMDVDLRTVLRWLIYGVIALIGLSLLGMLVDVASSLLWLLLKGGAVVLVVLFILEILEGFRE